MPVIASGLTHSLPLPMSKQIGVLVLSDTGTARRFSPCCASQAAGGLSSSQNVTQNFMLSAIPSSSIIPLSSLASLTLRPRRFDSSSATRPIHGYASTVLCIARPKLVFYFNTLHM